MPDRPSSSDDDLPALLAAAADDPARFARLVARAEGFVRSVAGPRCACAADVDDVVQDVWIRIIRHRYDRRRGANPAQAWKWLRLVTITAALNRCRSDGRRRRREAVAIRAIGSSDTTSPPSHRHEQQENLAVLFADLSPADRRILVLRHVEGLDHHALAAALGCTPDTARKRLERAHARAQRVKGRRGLSVAALIVAESAADAGVPATAIGMNRPRRGPPTTGPDVRAAPYPAMTWSARSYIATM